MGYTGGAYVDVIVVEEGRDVGGGGGGGLCGVWSSQRDRTSIFNLARVHSLAEVGRCRVDLALTPDVYPGLTPLDSKPKPAI